MNKIEIIPKID
jgi:hypothetical protein